MLRIHILTVSALLVTSGVLLSGSIGPAALPPPSPVDPLADALAMPAQATLLARLVASDGSLAERLLRAGHVSEAPPSPAPPSSLAAALGRLHAAAGLPPSQPDPLPPDLAAALAPLVDAVAAAAEAAQHAQAALSPEERAFLHAHLLTALDRAGLPGAEGDDARHALDLAARLDTRDLLLATAAVAAAADGFLASGPAATMAATWIDPSGMVEVGSTGPDCYTVERVLIVDLGGDDCYDNHPASYMPGSNLPVPVSVIVEVGGNDVYRTQALHASSQEFTWASAVGAAGIGLLVDRWGNDRHEASLTDVPGPCVEDPTVGSSRRHMVFAQGVGIAGVGALLDLGGDDAYLATSRNAVASPCHWSKSYVFAQGTGLHLGAGLLLDDTGNDRYDAHTHEAFEYDNVAHTMAQGSAASAVGTLLDKEGDDVYNATAVAEAPPASPIKGSHAYVFAQGSAFATREPAKFFTPSTAPALGCSLSYVDPSVAACVPAPCLFRPQAVDLQACNSAGAGLLVDLLGQDEFHAHAQTVEGPGCTVASWAVVSSQGSAAWDGLGALLNLDVWGADLFDLQADADANGGCSALARAHGQGFGGAILWDRADQPPLPLLGFGGLAGVDERNPRLAVGLMASGGLLEPDPCVSTTGDALVDPVLAVGCNTIGRYLSRAGNPYPTGLVDAPDQYSAAAGADNPGGTADAEAWVQGTGRSGTLAVPPLSAILPATVPAVHGIGVHLDVDGADFLTASTAATGATPAADTYAQAAGIQGTGVLVNLGDDDTYTAQATVAGVPMPANTHVQAYTEAATTTLPTFGPVCFAGPVNPQCVAYKASLLAVGVFADAFGTDSYSEAAERGAGCQADGQVLGAWPAPPLPGLGTVWWGTVLVHPCPLPPTPTTGNGLSVGVDWASGLKA